MYFRFKNTKHMSFQCNKYSWGWKQVSLGMANGTGEKWILAKQKKGFLKNY